jgi:diguanylate cyclase (GGDEF)-like protein/PAS domain S-box-containing protein
MLTSAAPENVISLLVIDDSRDRAEKYINAIRNAGIAVHADRLDTEEQLKEHLDQGLPDMVLCSCDSTQVSVSEAMNVFREHPEIPLLLLYHEKKDQDRAPLINAMRFGARDIIPRDDLSHLQLAVKRELDSLHARRALGEMGTKLKESEDRCNALMQSSREAIAYVHEGMHVRANPAYLKMFGYIDLDEIEGTPLLDMVTEEFHQPLKRILRSAETLDHSEPMELEAKCETTDGKNFDAVLELSPASIDGEPCLQVLVNNQRYKKELEEKLAKLSTMDVQTGLHNRLYFMSLLAGEEPHLLSSPSGHSLFYITIDGYSEIRNQTGIAECDRIVKELAALLAQQLSSDDILARFSEQSFTLLTQSQDKQELEKLANKICSSVETHVYQSNGKYLSPTFSIGIATYDKEKGPSPADFVSAALRANEDAEQKGGNRYAFAGKRPAKASVDSENSEQLEEMIKEAVANDRFRLVYQPIVSLQGDNRENYSVMIRMLSEDKQEVLPSDFLMQAEKNGQIVHIDKWMLEHALLELSRQRETGKDIHFFLPLSGASIQQEDFLLSFCNSLEQRGAKGSWLTFQVSEVNVRSRIQDIKKLVDAIKQLGCELAVDHFGLLPKGESLLRHLDADYVKLDSSLVAGIARNVKKQEEVTAIHQMINKSGAKTVATGVEDANSLAFLWNVGVNYLQGYFLQEPSEIISYDFSHF